MSLHGITACRGVATRLLGCIVLLAAPAVRGQGAQPSDNPLAEFFAHATLDRVPDPDESMAAYLAVAGWVRAWEPPPAGPGSLVEPAGCRVTLLRGGRVIGAHAARSEAGDGGGVIGQAAAGAMAGAERELLPRRDALWREQIRELAGDLTVSLELAGPMTPLAEADLARPDMGVRPGLDGLAVRVDGKWEVMFPSQLRAAEAAPAVEFPAMAARLLGDPTLGIELAGDLATKRGVAFYRFEVVHVAGVGAHGSPVFLWRGGRIVEQSEVTLPRLIGFAESMLAHMEATRHPEATRLGLMGTIHPARGAADPPVATPTQQSLAALALTGLARTPQASDAVRDRATALAGAIMADLQAVEEGEVATEEDGVAGAVAWVVLERLGAGRGESHELRPLFDQCDSMMREHALAGREEPRGTVGEAILVWALSERARLRGLDREVASRDLRALYRATEPGSLAGLMPWLGWAELALAPEGAVPAGAALRQIREGVWEHQLTPEDAGPNERDLVGGVVFTEGFVSLPSWSTVRPVAFCATMLGDGRLTGADELPKEIVRLLEATRFLVQLSAGEVECGFFPRPDLARGGIRAAVWDQRMPPEATALTLLTVSEFLRSLASAEAAKTPAQR